MGEQTLESRLWEDPFKAAARAGEWDGLDFSKINSPGVLTQIRARVVQSNDVLILPVPPPLDRRFEWHRPRVFFPGAAITNKSSVKPSVLVLWLNDSFFEDEPLLRLPMLLEPIMKAAKPYDLSPVKLIGPRRSS